MKTSIAIITAVIASASAFAPNPAFSRGSMKLFADEEEGGLDLNLEEMFDMFDAADKGKDFDESVKKIKSDKKDK